MSGAPLLPVLWVYGPPGAGKSTVAWNLFLEPQGRGMTVGYVDVDQLGMCYPQGLEHQMGHDPKAANIARVLENFRAAGTQAVIVSGVMDADAVPLYRLNFHPSLRMRCSASIEIQVKPAGAFGQRPDMSLLAAAPLAMKKTMTTAPASEE